MAEHNHMTRDIKPLWGGCRGCDEYHVNALQMRVAELRDQIDAARAEVAALKQAWDTGIKAVEYRVLDGLRAKVDVLEHDATCSFIPQDGPCDCVRGAVLALIEEAQPKQRTLRVELEDDDANISE